MKRYLFDMRDRNFLTQDEEGIELPDIESVQEEAALSLADMARNAHGPPERGAGHRMAIEVRDRSGPVLKVLFAFEVDRRKD